MFAPPKSPARPPSSQRESVKSCWFASANSIGVPVGDERTLHLRAVDPTDGAAVGANLEPVGAAHQDVYRLATIDHVEYRVSLAGPGMHFQIRVGHRHLPVFIIGGLSNWAGEDPGQYQDRDHQRLN